MKLRLQKCVERALVVLALVGAYSPYHLIPHYQDPAAARALMTPFDRALPTCPRWMLVYVAIYPLALAPVVFVREASAFRRLALAHALTYLIAFVVYLALPVTSLGLRASLDSPPADFFTWGLALNYALDPPLNCFPSLHVTTAVLSGLILRRVHRWLGLSTLGVAASIALSTMLVKQHYVADVVAGAALGVATYVGVVSPCRIEVAPTRWVLSRAVPLLGVFMLAIASVYAIFRGRPELVAVAFR